MDLWDEVPEAGLFAKSISDNIQNYKLHPTEEFSDIWVGTLATTAVDLQREAFTRQSLAAFVQQLEQETLWIGAHHDPLIQPYGRVVSAKLFYAPQSELYFVAAVVGLYDQHTLPKFEHFGLDLTTVLFDDIADVPRLESDKVQLAYSPHEIDRVVITELLLEAPEMVDRQPKRSLRKSADPITILSVLASFWLLTNNPFSKKFLERYGEKAADSSMAFFSWLSRRVFTKLNELQNRRVLFEFMSNYKGCRVQFVIPSKDLSVLCEATNVIYDGAQSAKALIDKLESLGLQRLIYEFDLNARKWLPLHATSKSVGVISDRPYLVALDQMKAFSVGGITSDDSIQEN
ncbi:MAG TPA: hypothetical protein VHS05_02930 [Pyrinomonadaceae bacterium]|jgi:hypothetical protein|nr:hypothetical protein [Pyrinomonadaceae bacterium]